MNLDIKICLGCGTVNPVSLKITHFVCPHCIWEMDNQLPTIRQIMGSKDIHNGVELGTLLKAILEPKDT